MLYGPEDCTVEEVERKYQRAEEYEQDCFYRAKELEGQTGGYDLTDAQDWADFRDSRDLDDEDVDCLYCRILGAWKSWENAERKRVYWEDQLQWARERQKREVEQ